MREITFASSPILRPDGTICTTAGYDAQTRLYYCPDPDLVLPEIPNAPNVHEVQASVDILNELIGDFPFADQASRANALSILFSILMRPVINGHIPLIIVDAPVQGSGKTLLVTALGTIAVGSLAGESIPSKQNDDEWRKKITSILLSASPFVLLDNIPDNTTIDSPALAAALTTYEWSDRLLGKNDSVRLPSRAVWAATGNNLRVAGDMPRRSYTVRLDANAERPWERSGFAIQGLEQYVAAHRGELLSATFTIIRAWYAAGQPRTEIPAFGSFDEWAGTIGSVLAFAGVEGFQQRRCDRDDRIVAAIGTGDVVKDVCQMHFNFTLGHGRTSLAVDGEESAVGLLEAARVSFGGDLSQDGRVDRGRWRLALSLPQTRRDHLLYHVPAAHRLASMANPRAQWIITPESYEEIIPPEMFQRAQAIFERRKQRYAPEQMLANLRALYEKYHVITSRLIKSEVNCPAPSLYCSRFGGLTGAFQAMFSDAVDRVRETVLEAIRHDVDLVDIYQDFIVINQRFTVLIQPSVPIPDGYGTFWAFRPDHRPIIDITLGVPLSSGETREILGYLALPRLMVRDPWVRLSSNSDTQIEMHGYNGLDLIRELTQ